jgi:hypothetical protein
MAEKISDSIKRNLSRLRKVLDPEPSKPSAAKEGTREQRPLPPKADRSARPEDIPDDSEATPKKKVPAKPWYRHRQRW